ncbi:hypothetical protein [Paenibacillus sp. CF384]|uniref:hypothetical protein n=1 Tax=Paenibacillus sp. CF384 TaxID=1884382 RepID=UPI0008971E8D|nr:hypothetical protein [Paenibacillus sp. CF384]SDX26348.1 hypothetical protein SAMN05518855_101165 [Paenibacillus sp. CF384]
MSIFGVFFIIILAFIVLKLFQSRGTQQQSRAGGFSAGGGRRNVMPMRKPPEYLGVPEGHPARSAAERLEAALSEDFEARVKDRVMKRTPSMREGEWQWQWFELKRYFLMCGVLRNVPMYSVRVDEVWHEMLMFTREYEQFCKQFCGGTIHHAPHGADAKPAPGERAWFDWIYGELFLPVPVSGQLWGAFYRTPLPHELMDELETSDTNDLRSKRFNEKAATQFNDLSATIDYLIDRGGKLASAKEQPIYKDNRVMDSSDMMTTGVLSGMFFYSSFGPIDNFHNQMDENQTEEQRNANGDGSSGTAPICSNYDDDRGSSDYNDGGNNDAGNGDSGNGGFDGGGSNCSSGGGDSGGGSSCGSSCGGGSS